MQLCALIMAGGRGERFWPVSNLNRPKQLLHLGMQKPLVVQSVERLERKIPRSQMLIVTSAGLVKQFKQILPKFPAKNIIGEPVGKNTAPCIGLAAVWMKQKWGPDCIMAVQTADHFIENQEAFDQVMQTGAEAAAQGHLVTIGLKPTRPETGYGYLEISHPIDEAKGLYQVRRFLEKPDAERAWRFYQQDKFLWNGGMFFWKCSRILEELYRHLPEIQSPLVEYAEALGRSEDEAALEKAYQAFPSISIDYAVMEKTNDVLTVKADMGWDDLGNWAVLERLLGQNAEGNVVIGNHAGVDTTGCIISSDKGLIATLGVENLVIVQQDDVILVMPKDKAPDLKELVARLKENPEFEKYL